MSDLVISNLWTASGKIYEVIENGMRPNAFQYIDRDYTFSHIPDWLQGHTLIKTAGDDKMYEGHESCLSFEINCAANVYVLFGDRFETKPVWLHEFVSTDKKVLRSDADTNLMKGIFTVFSRAFSPGIVELGGCLPRGMLTPAFRETKGYTYCMYSVVVALA